MGRTPGASGTHGRERSGTRQKREEPPPPGCRVKFSRASLRDSMAACAVDCQRECWSMPMLMVMPCARPKRGRRPWSLGGIARARTREVLQVLQCGRGS